jgi:hypothetical protein
MAKKLAATLAVLALGICFDGLVQPLSASTTTVAGTLVVNFTFTVDSALPAGAQLYCTATATVKDPGSGASISEGASSQSLASSGGVCSVAINYSWKLASSSTDKIVLSYSLSTSPSSDQNHESRTSQIQNFVTISVPANGTTTTENLAVTI